MVEILEVQLRDYKNINGEFKKLTEIVDIAKDLGYLTKIFKKNAKRIIELGDIGVHCFTNIPKKDILKEEIENLRIILLHLFHSI